MAEVPNQRKWEFLCKGVSCSTAEVLILLSNPERRVPILSQERGQLRGLFPGNNVLKSWEDFWERPIHRTLYLGFFQKEEDRRNGKIYSHTH